MVVKRVQETPVRNFQFNDAKVGFLANVDANQPVDNGDPKMGFLANVDQPKVQFQQAAQPKPVNPMLQRLAMAVNKWGQA